MGSGNARVTNRTREPNHVKLQCNQSRRVAELINKKCYHNSDNFKTCWKIYNPSLTYQCCSILQALSRGGGIHQTKYQLPIRTAAPRGQLVAIITIWL